MVMETPSMFPEDGGFNIIQTILETDPLGEHRDHYLLPSGMST